MVIVKGERYLGLAVGSYSLRIKQKSIQCCKKVNLGRIGIKLDLFNKNYVKNGLQLILLLLINALTLRAQATA